MKKSELQTILKDYVTLIVIEHHLFPISYTDIQWKIMTENLEQFYLLCNEDTDTLLFFYVWYNHREIYHQVVLWENVFKDGEISKEQFEKMLQSWSSLENNIIKFTKENQKLLETSKNKQQNNDLEHER